MSSCRVAFNITDFRRPGDRDNFVACYNAYTVADYFGLSPLTELALDALGSEFDEILRHSQLRFKNASDWMPGFLSAVCLVWEDVPIQRCHADAGRNNGASSDTSTTTDNGSMKQAGETQENSNAKEAPSNPLEELGLGRVRALFITFVYAARVPLLKNPTFTDFLDANTCPAFALDMFQVMRWTKNFEVLETTSILDDSKSMRSAVRSRHENTQVTTPSFNWQLIMKVVGLFFFVVACYYCLFWPGILILICLIVWCW
ncbi:hypothetical protein VTJ83DRAFT_2876 [Remersonia thermophila]|uniref:Uncharacterized protein n=1 Tax=Remersonia thermophila TaxID=72144 RepID=A0ABR4DCJ5_9PEZI